MTFQPTNVYRQLGEEFAYSIHTQLDALTLRRALAIDSKIGSDEEESAGAPADATTWTVVLPLGPEFEPTDVAVRLDSAGVFWVNAEAASRWQDGDFVRLVRRLPLPADRVDTGSTRCWIEEDCLMLRADRLPQAARAAAAAAVGKKSPALVPTPPTLTTAAWPPCSLANAQQRHGCLVKDKSARAAGTKWTLDLAMPEFDLDEITVTRTADTPARLLVTASHIAEADAADASGVSSSVRHEYRREIAPPAGVQLDQLVTRRLGATGVLRLEAPAAAGGAKARGLRLGGGTGSGSGGGPVAKIASLTRELRHHHSSAAHQQQQQQNTASASASASASVSPSTERAASSRNCVVQ